MKYFKIKYLSFLFLISFAVDEVKAQKSDTGTWFMYFGNNAINKKWNWHNEVQYRNYDFVGDLQQLLLRTGIGYNLSENNNNVLLGYAYVRSENYLADFDRKIVVDENRIFQQFITRQNFGRFYLQHRFRFEERFIKEKFEMRYRYFLSVNIPINKPTMDKGAFYFSVYNEIFLNGQTPVFDRDRLYGALGYVINKNLRIEAGFMRQIQEFSGRNQFQIGFYNSIPFSSN